MMNADKGIITGQKEYIIFCDESIREGEKYSNFYGGLMVGAKNYQKITDNLNDVKKDLNLFNELKWQRVTNNYLDKYKEFISAVFKYIADNDIHIRIMFLRNNDIPKLFSNHDYDRTYFKLYYQFIKHAFGMQYISKANGKVNIRIYLDKLPSAKKQRILEFRDFISKIPFTNEYKNSAIRIKPESIVQIDSREHVLLQSLDIILGAMAFRLNNRHTIKIQGSTRRGKRTIAKDSLYKFIHERIVEIYPNFNVGITTGLRGELMNRWNDPYRHWSFKPSISK